MHVILSGLKCHRCLIVHLSSELDLEVDVAIGCCPDYAGTLHVIVTARLLQVKGQTMLSEGYFGQPFVLG